MRAPVRLPQPRRRPIATLLFHPVTIFGISYERTSSSGRLHNARSLIAKGGRNSSKGLAL
jgi:hypothetical protein